MVAARSTCRSVLDKGKLGEQEDSFLSSFDTNLARSRLRIGFPNGSSTLLPLPTGGRR